MFKKTLMSLVVCFTVISLSSGMVLGKGKGKDLGDKIFKKMHIALKEKAELGLSDAQLEKIIDLKVSAKKDYTMKKAEIKNTKLDLKVQLMKDEIDIRKVNSLIDKKYDIKAQKAKALIEAYVELKDVLSEKQMDQLKEIYKKKCSKSGYKGYDKKGKGNMGYMQKKEGMHHMKR